MDHFRIKTAHLQAMQAWRRAGKSLQDYNACMSLRMKEAARKPKPALSEEIQAAMTFKENKRKGWKSVIRDKRL
jgi:hypothetical protein